MAEETKTTQETQESTNTAQMVATILNIVFTAVLPGVIKLIEELRKSNLTVEDVEKLRLMVKRPEEYFPQPPPEQPPPANS